MRVYELPNGKLHFIWFADFAKENRNTGSSLLSDFDILFIAHSIELTHVEVVHNC
jgi:hypothetical protein